ncbi:hypothetical protein KVR01_012324 [Diaporthe batatas]|uniref:uncharacterized protein n=1 Tax=Diaporthe batatas TaxID=748121 RepID=UPI001D05B7CC|nr:uncharacterized protein KVR01_012324 [Diaporthe batatas]KAG8157662.1 hypothetical protein KVR01_012324 [Diaporthe batatas]
MLFSDDNLLSCRRPEAPASSEPGMPPIPEALTVIITTSPTPSAPSTELLDTILASFHEHCPLLLECNVVVVLDTYDRIAPVNRLKKGSVTAEGAQNFAAYKDNVKRLVLKEFVGAESLEEVLLLEDCGQAEYGSPCIATNFTALKIQRTEDERVVFIEPSERLGFGLAVRSALRLVDTPYVWVQQHDWNLIVSIPIQSIVEVMVESDSSEDAPVKYVCLPSPRMLEYADSSHVKPFPGLRETTAALKRDFLAPSSPHKVPLTPLFFWHDKTHVASTKHYLNRVFPTRLAMARGAFIEDHIGQRARNQMKEGLFTKWACWLYYPDGGKLQCLRHLHGRTWRGREAEREKVEASKLQGGASLSVESTEVSCSSKPPG